ncbi:hypothetical protein GH733_016674 [Mirounga leonina]|nr:hypothetical protein GH733_016674 [Mirounga leonina]
MSEMQQPSPPIPLVHPDGQFKNLPFYDVPDVLIKPTSLAESRSGRRDYIVQVQLGLCLAETSCSQEQNYPNSLCIKVNGNYALPPKSGIEYKYIFGWVIFSCAKSDFHFLGIRNWKELLHVCISCMKAHISHKTKEKLTAAPDSEIPSGILDVPFKENEARNPMPCSDLYTSKVF